MEPITLAGGLYAVFIHKGAASMGPETFRRRSMDPNPAKMKR